MVEKIEGIVIDMVRHNDRHDVVTLYTRTRGRVAFLVPSGKSKQSVKRRASLKLLCCVSADVNFKNGRELQLLPSVATGRVWRNLYVHPVKITLVFFISEFLNKFLRQSPPDTGIWDYIVNSLGILDDLPENRLSNFHIAFLKGLIELAGILPATGSYAQGMSFDMEAGEFRDPRLIFTRFPRTLLSESESSFVTVLSRINFRNMHLFRFTRTERGVVLERLLQYFSIHFSTGFNLKSTGILADIFL